MVRSHASPRRALVGVAAGQVRLGEALLVETAWLGTTPFMEPLGNGTQGGGLLMGGAWAHTL